MGAEKLRLSCGFLHEYVYLCGQKVIKREVYARKQFCKHNNSYSKGYR